MNWFKRDRGASEHAGSGSRPWSQSNGSYDMGSTAPAEGAATADARDVAVDLEASTRAYNPYSELQGLHRGVDSSALQRMYSLPTAPEFLFAEQAKKRRNSAIEYLTYNTGTGWFGGVIGGGGYGLVEGVRTKSPEGVPDTVRLRINRILNSTGTRGRNVGNVLGCICFIYSSIEGLIWHLRDGEEGFVNSALAAGITGSLYRSTSGMRSSAIGGAVGLAAISVITMGRNSMGYGD